MVLYIFKRMYKVTKVIFFFALNNFIHISYALLFVEEKSFMNEKKITYFKLIGNIESIYRVI